MLYLDANATSPTTCLALKEFHSVIRTGPLNPSSAHEAGRKALRILECARDTVADTLGCDEENVFFTSGGTEGNNLAVSGFAKLQSASTSFSAVEHPSVSGPCSHVAAQPLGVDASGAVKLDVLDLVLRSAAGQPHLVCVQAANSETGVVQPLSEIRAAVARHPNAYLMVDAAQAYGRVRLDLEGVDVLTASGHKFGAPAGSGFVYLSDRMLSVLPPSSFGGGQEGGIRPGTQPVALAAGLAAAAEERFEDLEGYASAMRSIRDAFEDAIVRLVPGTAVVAKDAERLPNTSNILFSGEEALSLVARLDAAGVMASAGTACAAARPQASPVLLAMGYGEDEALSCVRFSFGPWLDHSDIERAAGVVAETAKGRRA